ncbi:MAG: hypothetical protein CVU57_01605 [Deltaproteobacteria bacterium HGW-Deltaproteobacteria-15]|jgi:hypothetical protein|nr:MAG: hypothetical protein CVU57_01605 [Deltaproteobacteria bacterium HGW-Deltaproteobacteria-15]
MDVEYLCQFGRGFTRRGEDRLKSIGSQVGGVFMIGVKVAGRMASGSPRPSPVSSESWLRATPCGGVHETLVPISV